jgi:hypothetical protein
MIFKKKYATITKEIKKAPENLGGPSGAFNENEPKESIQCPNAK